MSNFHTEGSIQIGHNMLDTRSCNKGTECVRIVRRSRLDSSCPFPVNINNGNCILKFYLVIIIYRKKSKYLKILRRLNLFNFNLLFHKANIKHCCFYEPVCPAVYYFDLKKIQIRYILYVQEVVTQPKILNRTISQIEFI